jgi:hypothetical protein
MELFVAILISLGFITPDAAYSMSAPELNQYVATQQTAIDQAIQDPTLMQQANQILPSVIDRLED